MSASLLLSWQPHFAASLDNDTIVSIAATLIALFALGLSIYEGVQTRKHNRLSVRPFLSDSLRLSPAYPRFSLAVSNSGLGPAIIKSHRLLVDGKSPAELEIKKREQLTAHLGLPDKVNYTFLDPGSVLPAGGVEELVGTDVGTYSPERVSLYWEAFRRLTITIVYESMYQEEEFRYEFNGQTALKPWKSEPVSGNPPQAQGTDRGSV